MMAKIYKHTVIRTQDMDPRIKGYDEIDMVTGDYHSTTIVPANQSGEISSPKCPACGNEFSLSIDESGTICTPDKCILTNKKIPEDTMRWMRYEMVHRGEV